MNAELEGELVLSPDQKKDWDAILQNLKQSIHSHDLKQVLAELIFPVEIIERIQSQLREESGNVNRLAIGPSVAEERKLTLAASERATELLLARQKQWLRQVSLQHCVASTGGKFPLRFSWTRRQIHVRPD